MGSEMCIRDSAGMVGRARVGIQFCMDNRGKNRPCQYNCSKHSVEIQARVCVHSFYMCVKTSKDASKIGTSEHHAPCAKLGCPPAPFTGYSVPPQTKSARAIDIIHRTRGNVVRTYKTRARVPRWICTEEAREPPRLHVLMLDHEK